MKKTIFFCGVLITPIMLFSYTLEQKYKNLQHDKAQAEVKFEELKKHSALWGKEGYGGRHVNQLYTTRCRGLRYSELFCLFDPLEYTRLAFAYTPLALIAIPVLAVSGIADWSEHREADEQKLKECADNLEKIEQEIKKTDEDMRVEKLQQLHEHCKTICRE